PRGVAFACVDVALRAPGSFPTRRSSDLEKQMASGPRRPCGAARRSCVAGAQVGHRRAVSGIHHPQDGEGCGDPGTAEQIAAPAIDRKSTRLNSSHVKISYAVFCLKKKTR